MKEVTVQTLTRDAFEKYGSFSEMVEPRGPHLGSEPCEFYRDRAILTLNTCNTAFSVTRVCKRPKIVSEVEYHTHTGEAILPLDGDILIHVAPASPANQTPAEEIEVFLVPKGTLVVLRPGVWHGAPYCVDTDVTNILVALPERAYVNDCVVVQLSKAQAIRIAEL
ncbi:MAG: ureidoglycolate lyase [Eubacteriales bacterium]|nr:ureidoglycolate lyase [Eubacteriales bacterium]